MNKLLISVFILLVTGASCVAQNATIDWMLQFQRIDGFGGAVEFKTYSLGDTKAQFFFGTGPGQLGLSILRVGPPIGPGSTSYPSWDAGDCSTVNTSCAGMNATDISLALQYGSNVKILTSTIVAPMNMMSNGFAWCSTSGSGAVLSGSYTAFATWLANYIKSVKQVTGADIFAITPANEPDQCPNYTAAQWSDAQLDTFIKNDMGPVFASQGITATLIMDPEVGHYATLPQYSGCATDTACAQYVGSWNYHDYDAYLIAQGNVSPGPLPSGFPATNHYWETEASCGAGFGPSFCESGFTTDMASDGLGWAAVLDQRMVDGLNAYMYWWLEWGHLSTDDDEGLVGVTPQGADIMTARAYVFGQYAHWIRPGYSRIAATHKPQAGVSVTAYQDLPSNTIVIVATNYTASARSQTFTISSGPTFSTLTPYTTTSASSGMVQQAAVSPSNNSFAYSLPAQSVTTFVGQSGTSSTVPATPTDLKATVQ
jgi:glucuronoarabinoxylan endo-1,4-beta-xylanase